MTSKCQNCEAVIVKLHDNEHRYCSRDCKESHRRNVFASTRPKVLKFSGKTRLLQGNIIVNEEYYEWLGQYRWSINENGYATRTQKIDGKPRAMRLHRVIMDAQPGQLVDHENRNKLDNRVSNLRFLSSRQNSFNTDRTDKAKYYFWNTQESKWTVRRFGKRFAAFRTEQEAIDYVEEHIRYMPIPEWGNMYAYRQDLLRKKVGL